MEGIEALMRHVYVFPVVGLALGAILGGVAYTAGQALPAVHGRQLVSSTPPVAPEYVPIGQPIGRYGALRPSQYRPAGQAVHAPSRTYCPSGHLTGWLEPAGQYMPVVHAWHCAADAMPVVAL